MPVAPNNLGVVDIFHRRWISAAAAVSSKKHLAVFCNAVSIATQIVWQTFSGATKLSIFIITKLKTAWTSKRIILESDEGYSCKKPLKGVLYGSDCFSGGRSTFFGIERGWLGEFNTPKPRICKPLALFTCEKCEKSPELRTAKNVVKMLRSLTAVQQDNHISFMKNLIWLHPLKISCTKDQDLC